MKKPAKKKKKTCEPNRIDIFILNKYIDTTIDINPKKTTTMQHLSHKEEYALANKLAEALNEPHNLPLYVKFAQTVPKDYLLKKLAYVLSKDDIENKAAYFNSIVNTYAPRHKHNRD